MKTWKMSEERPSYRVTIIIETEEGADLDGRGKYGGGVEPSCEAVCREVRDAVERGRELRRKVEPLEEATDRAVKAVVRDARKIADDLGEKDIPADID